MLKMHESQRHLAMIGNPVELFTHLRYQFESQPFGLENDVDRSFQPNLALKKDGERIYMEVEISHMKKRTWTKIWRIPRLPVGVSAWCWIL
jgi:hypothetical protein